MKPSAFRPLPGTHRALPVTGAASSLVTLVAASAVPAFKTTADTVQLQADGADIRITFDGTNPTAAVGYLLRQTDVPLLVSRSEADAAKVLAPSGAATLQLSEYGN